MRVVPFPEKGKAADPEKAWLDELEAALSGAAEGPRADSWRELREDVRALAPAMAPAFEGELRRRIDEARKHHGSGKRDGLRKRGRIHGSRWLPASPPNSLRGQGPLAAALASGVAVLLVVALVMHPWSASAPPRPVFAAPGAARAGAAVEQPRATSNQAVAGADVQSAPTAGVAAPVSPSASAADGAAGRVQQRAASVSLGARPSEVQTVADGVARLAASVGGFVESSHVQVQQEGSSGAQLTLSIPSAKLDAALASLGQLAPVRAESQSAQDITDSYDAASRRLSDLNAERQALLRALSAASTQGQIESLRERLAGVSRAIAQARVALQQLSRQASTSEVEVSVLGDGHGSSEGLTLHRGLHDAGRVLLVTLTVLLVGAAVLVPLALLIAAVLAGRSAFVRYRRERVLDV